MHELQKKELDRALVFLNSIGCKYKVSHPDGIDFTNIVEEVAKKRSASHYPKGDLINHIRKYITDIQIGEVRSIPEGSFDLARISSCATSYMSTTYGNKSYTSHRAKDTIEIMRIF